MGNVLESMLEDLCRMDKAAAGWREEARRETEQRARSRRSAPKPKPPIQNQEETALVPPQADEIIASLKQHPELFWAVATTIHDQLLAGPWCQDESGHFIRQALDKKVLARIEPSTTGWAITLPRVSIGHRVSLAGAKQIADGALKVDGYRLV